jgi:hypothetical protein
MIGSDLEGADLESQVANWAASATSDDAAAVRTVIEALRSDSTTSPSKATSGQSGQQARGRSRSALPARRKQRVSGSCSFWNGRRPLEDHAVHVPAVAGAVEGAAPASSESAPGFGHVPHPLAVAEHDAAPTVTLIYLPVQGPCR